MLTLLFIATMLLMVLGICIAGKLSFLFFHLANNVKNKYAKSMAEILGINSGIMIVIGCIMLIYTIKRFLAYPNLLSLTSVLPAHFIVTFLFVSAQGLFYWLVEKKKLNGNGKCKS